MDREEQLTERSLLLLDGPSQGNSTCQQEQDSDDRICIMVAGKPGNGKSSALNNIFGLNLATNISSRSVTTKISKLKIVKNGYSLIAIDTPGLGALDINKETITTAMLEALDGMDYTLLYCLSVGPGSRLTETDKAIIQNLHATLGKGVWDKCVILFTFSDTARRECFNSASQEADYKAYLNDVADTFSDVIKTCNSDVPTVKSIFQCKSSGDIYERVETVNEIVAIPVGKTVDRQNEPNILPGILEPTGDWTDLVFVELMRKTKEKRRKGFVALKYGAAIAGGLSAFVIAGAAIGGAGGAAAGILGGPIGVVAAGGVGAAVGAAMGAAVGMSITSIVASIKLKKRNKAKQQLLPDKEFSS